jgi:hypothetical protein
MLTGTTMFDILDVFDKPIVTNLVVPLIVVDDK